VIFPLLFLFAFFNSVYYRTRCDSKATLANSRNPNSESMFIYIRQCQ